eukprot:8808341-Heterocapsa_arctica.AAC.1
MRHNHYPGHHNNMNHDDTVNYHHNCVYVDDHHDTIDNNLHNNIYDDKFFLHEDKSFQISREVPKRKHMPMVKKENWKKSLDHVANLLDDDEHDQNFDVLAFDGKGIGTPSSSPNRNNIHINFEGTMDSGASNSVAPIEAVP